MRFTTKNILIKLCCATLVAGLFMLFSYGKTFADITCDPNIQTPSTYQQCLNSPASGSTIECKDGSTVVAPSTCPTDSATGGSSASAACTDFNTSNCTKCKDVKTSTDCIPAADAQCSGSTTDEVLACSSIMQKFVDPLIRFLAIGVGVIVTIMIIIGGVQYATASGNPQAAAAARKRIFSAILALVVFALLYALLNWIVPGGVRMSP